MVVLIFLSLIVGVIVASTLKERKAAMGATGVATKAVMPIPDPLVPTPAAEVEGIQPRQFVVRHLRRGMATMIMRHRPRAKGCTAQLIVWSGKKKASIQDSYFDLGLISAPDVAQDVIEQFIQKANVTLDDLIEKGKQKKVRKPRVASAPAAAPAVEPAAAPMANDLHEVESADGSMLADYAAWMESGTDIAPPDVIAQVVEPQQVDSKSVKIKRFPSVSKGEILEAGIMPRVLGDSVKEMFGIRYRTSSGAEDFVWGANLRVALKDAKASVGDSVEILKIGRKTMEAGKAPMSLYKIERIAV